MIQYLTNGITVAGFYFRRSNKKHAVPSQ